MRPTSLLAAVLLPYPALPAPPADGIVSVGRPYGDDGSAWLHFADGARVPTLPAVVVTTARHGAWVPPEHARPIGSSGTIWRIRTATAAEAVALARSLANTPGITGVSPDLLLARRATTFDDPYLEGQWYLELLSAPSLWEIEVGDPAVRVAVIDSGIALAHPDLAGATVAPYDAFDDDEDPSPIPGEFCPNAGGAVCDDHGTAVAGIIAARAGNGVGIAGLCPECTVVPIKMLGEGRAPLGHDLAAFDHAIAQDVGVINNSWGYTEAIPVPAPLAAVVRRATTEPRGGLGALVVFAAGNDDREIRDDELQALPEVLTVGATDRYGLPTAYTNSGAALDVAAPSATVTLDGRGGVTTTFGGTSAAAPVVSGLAAWALSVDPDLSATDLHQLLIDAAVPSPLVTPDASGHHPVYGYGEVSGEALLELLFPDEQTQEGRGCGCDTRGVAPSGLLLAILAGSGLLRARRTRAG